MNILRRLVVGLALASMACGGRIDPDDEDGGTGEGGTGSSTFSPCPTDLPSPGSTCTGPNEEACTYPTVGGGCQSFVCNGASLWVSTPRGC